MWRPWEKKGKQVSAVVLKRSSNYDSLKPAVMLVALFTAYAISRHFWWDDSLPIFYRYNFFRVFSIYLYFQNTKVRSKCEKEEKCFIYNGWCNLSLTAVKILYPSRLIIFKLLSLKHNISTSVTINIYFQKMLNIVDFFNFYLNIFFSAKR